MGVVTLDLSFLAVPLGPMPAPARPVNVYDILGEAWRETRVDMTLQFFLDPNERHGLGTLVMDALLTVLDGAPMIGAEGKTDTLFAAEDYAGSDAWEIDIQFGYIDVYATNKDRGIAVVLENKIGHKLDNPLDRYAVHALGDPEITAVLVAVLAPEHRVASQEQENWLSRSITYTELADEIKHSPELVHTLLDPVDRDQRRSLDLLQQFIEARTRETDVTDLSSEAVRLNEWRALLAEHQEAITRFDAAKKEVARLLRERTKHLADLLVDRISEARLETTWEAHGGAPDGVGVDFWNAYCFAPENWSVELKFSTLPERASIYVFDYQGRTYKPPRMEPLGLEWTASDEEIADAFINRVKLILEQVRNGVRSGDRVTTLLGYAAKVIDQGATVEVHQDWAAPSGAPIHYVFLDAPPGTWLAAIPGYRYLFTTDGWKETGSSGDPVAYAGVGWEADEPTRAALVTSAWREQVTAIDQRFELLDDVHGVYLVQAKSLQSLIEAHDALWDQAEIVGHWAEQVITSVEALPAPPPSAGA